MNWMFAASMITSFSFFGDRELNVTLAIAFYSSLLCGGETRPWGQ